MALSAFDHLVVRVGDIDEGIATYRDKLGLTLDRTDENDALGIKQAFFNLPGGGFIEVVAPTDQLSPQWVRHWTNGARVSTRWLSQSTTSTRLAPP